MKKVIFFVILTSFSNYLADGKNIVCYYGSWATYRNGLGKFDVDNINPYLCTHLVYAFAGISSQSDVVSLDSWLDLPDNWGRDNFRKFNALKQKNANLKTLLAVGGWNEGSAKYSFMAANLTLRKNFINSAIKMVRSYGFDGLDIDWEYPNRRDSVYGAADIENFTQLLKELREAFDVYGLLLTAAVSATEEAASLSYDVPAISQYLDIISIMTYDMYGAWDVVTGHNAPLHKGQGDENKPKEEIHSVDVALEYWLGQGCPPQKLVVGIPFYGRTFYLTNPHVNGVRAPSSGAGLTGPYTATSGLVGYNEFCYMLKTENWSVKRDGLAKVPYAVKGLNWVSYDDPISVADKVEYALKYNISGVMVWSIETDDFYGLCDGVDFPLLRAINNALDGNVIETTVSSNLTTTMSSTSNVTTSSPSDSTTTGIPSNNTTKPPTITESPSNNSSSPSTTTESAQEDELCKTTGLAPNPSDCNSFVVCITDASGGLVPKYFKCPSGLAWDQQNLSCNYSDLVQCD